MTPDQAYTQAFETKCAEHNVDPNTIKQAYYSFEQRAQPRNKPLPGYLRFMGFGSQPSRNPISAWNRLQTNHLRGIGNVAGRVAKPAARAYGQMFKTFVPMAALGPLGIPIGIANLLRSRA